MANNSLNLYKTHRNFFSLVLGMSLLAKLSMAWDMLTIPEAFAGPTFTYTFIFIPVWLFGSLFLLSAAFGIYGAIKNQKLMRAGAGLGLTLFSIIAITFAIAYISGGLPLRYPVGIYSFLAFIELVALKEPFINPASMVRKS